jgi:hypothetical protein
MQKKPQVSSKMISRATLDTVVSEFEAKLAAWKKGNKRAASRDLTAASSDGEHKRFEITR